MMTPSLRNKPLDSVAWRICGRPIRPARCSKRWVARWAWRKLRACGDEALPGAEVQLDASNCSSHSLVYAPGFHFLALMKPETQPTILVVEDDATDAFLLRRALAKTDRQYQLRFVGDGQCALNYLDGTVPYGD